MALRNGKRLMSAKTGKFVVTGPKVTVRVSKETGGAYADMGEVIQSELAQIRQKFAKDKPEQPRNNGLAKQ